jgi:hypothetical protein
LINEDGAAFPDGDETYVETDGAALEGCEKGLPQFPQNFALSMFWLRQTEQINIRILPKFDLNQAPEKTVIGARCKPE